MSNTETNRYFVLSICRKDLERQYPVKYQEDTKRYPVFQNHLDDKDDKIFIVHESDIKNIECELDFIEADCFFEFGNINHMVVESEDTDEIGDVWLDHNYGCPVGTSRDKRQRQLALG